MTTTKKPRGANLSSRPFYTTLLLLSLFAVFSFLVRTGNQNGRDDSDHLVVNKLIRRDGGEETECNQVHAAKDRCAFVKEHCADDNAGLIPYLTLYYCTFGNVQPIAFIFLTAWLGLLFTTIGIAASDFFSVNLNTIATILGLSESLAGVTFLAFGNGSPDVFSTFAAMSSNSASMAVGELIGAACFISGVVAGSMSLVREFRVARKPYTRDICFFIVAIAFTMVFLADGHLHFWECCVMIGYYVVYVFTVVCWHWITKRRRQRMRREGEARSHVYAAVGHEADELAGEPYRDDPDDGDQGVGSGRGSTHTADFLALDAGPRIEVSAENSDAGDDESGSDHERMMAAEVASNMRVLRTRGKRSNTITPIRPSLVGALEFRSALAQLQREGTLPLATMHGRSRSEILFNHKARRGTTTGTPESPTPTGPHLSISSDSSTARRERALSSGDAPISCATSAVLLELATPDTTSNTLSVPSSTFGDDRTSSPSPSYTIDGNLAPPPVGQSGTTHDAPEIHTNGGLAPRPQLTLQTPSRRSSHSERSSPASPFPTYSDSPMLFSAPQYGDHQTQYFPSPMPESRPVDMAEAGEWPGPTRWWPYSVLPPPHVLLATAFPTLQGWNEKTLWDKFVSAISVPSIFLLVITLPVVESDANEVPLDLDTFIEHPSHGDLGRVAPAISIEPSTIEPEPETEWERYRRHTRSRSSSRISSECSPRMPWPSQAETAVGSSSQLILGPPAIVAKSATEIPSISNANDETAGWNRWLVALQLFTGPQFAVIILWANLKEDLGNPGRVLLKAVAYTFIVSLMLMGGLLLFTSEHSRPRCHYSLCFLGFIISIAWISTVAGEVVGALKAFGIIFKISEALLGLTIFAAGNSVGDLVANVTVARLGFPVMALSACFGGPMLNILLGIGIGGVLMMVKRANHRLRKHPDKPYEYKPYPIQVGGTLMISAITLLIILGGLLIMVPLNKWVLSRKIGWVLISLWVISTVLNVVIEMTGVWGDMA